jgi:hypothetical protein
MNPSHRTSSAASGLRAAFRQQKTDFIHFSRPDEPRSINTLKSRTQNIADTLAVYVDNRIALMKRAGNLDADAASVPVSRHLGFKTPPDDITCAPSGVINFPRPFKF